MSESLEYENARLRAEVEREHDLYLHAHRQNMEASARISELSAEVENAEKAIEAIRVSLRPFEFNQERIDTCVTALVSRLEATENMHDALMAEVKKMRREVEWIIAVLGPEPTNCGCAGCHEEISEALAAARRAIAPSGLDHQEPKEPKP